jgi:hypothetical protein
VPKGRSTNQENELQRVYGDLPVVDAKSDLFVFAADEDIADATQGDPHSCAFSLACRRLYGSSAAVFFRSVAYVDLPGPRGGRRQLHRFRVPPETRELIEDFDRTGTTNPGGYLLKAPSPSRTLEAARASASNHRRAALKGEARRKGPKKADPLTLQGVRNGTGQVQFIRQDKQ